VVTVNPGNVAGVQVAIVGMAALFPGAANLDGYWRNLVDGVDAITEVPPARWDPEFFDPDQADRPDRVYCRRGGFVDDLVTFQPLRFGIMPASVPSIEPDQLIALNVATAAIDDAGGPDRLPDRERVGVILGRGGNLSPAQGRHYQQVRIPEQVIGILHDLFPEAGAARLERVRERLVERLGPHQPEGTIGLVPNLAASRVANRLDLHGPAYTVDAACASALLAVDQAVAELTSGRLDAVLAGGVHHAHDITFWSVFSQLGALSRQGRIRPFDQAADGLLIGEGTGMVVLKRLRDAISDGDRIYAVVRGTGVSSDGRGTSMVNPSTAGQALAIRRAWSSAGLDPAAPDALGLLEAHGTATPAGDRAELATVAEVFGAHRGGEKAVIGSVKSMIGHTMPAAGIAGLIKAALAVHHGVLLPTLHCDSPNEGLARTRFAPIAAAKPWEGPGPRRAGVNAFGFGGINAHTVIEQAPETTTRARRQLPRTGDHDGPEIRLDLGGQLVRLGPDAQTLLDLAGTPRADPGASAPALAAGSRIEAEFAGLVHEATGSASAVLRAAAAPPPPARGKVGGVRRGTLHVSLESMPYLRDHCLLAQPPDWPTAADRFPLVPATTMVRHMMDAAERAVPGTRAVEVREARFLRWLTAAPASDVEVVVRSAAPGLLDVRLGDFARAVVAVSTAYPAPSDLPWRHDPGTERPVPISAETMYAERMLFHGPLFQGITDLPAIGDRHIRGVLSALDTPGALLDTALQTVGVWLAATQETRAVALPTRIGRIQFFGPQPPAGTALEVFTRIRSIDSTEAVSDIQLVTGERVFAQLSGFVARRFDSQPQAIAADRSPGRKALSQRHPEGWTVAFSSWTDPASQGFAARGALGGTGYLDYERQPVAGRLGWLLGRIAAKDAARFRLWDAGHAAVFPIELTLDTDETGRTVVRPCPGRDYAEHEVAYASAAEAGVAIAASGRPGRPGPGIAVTEGTDEQARLQAATDAVASAAGVPPSAVVIDATGPVTAVVSGHRYQVHFSEIDNPPHLPRRRYVVAWTTADHPH
jgi:3-oxoacyl-(acyl-carrier-protein) synthase